MFTKIISILALPFVAFAINIQSFYAGGFGGVNFVQYDKDQIKFHFDPGYSAGAFVGYRWCDGLRLELEGSYRYNRIKSAKIKKLPTVHLKGHLSTWSTMVNGYYDFPLWCLSPYLGAGIGYDATHTPHLNDQNGFAWQLMAGALYSFYNCLETGLEYRFHHGKQNSLYNHTVDLRFNWFF